MLRAVPFVLALLLLVPGTAASRSRRDRDAPVITHLRVDDGGAPWPRDSSHLATVSQEADSLRRSATIRFDLSEPATVTVELARTLRTTSPLWQTTEQLDAGPQAISWQPATPIAPRTYLVRLRAVDAAGNVRTVGARSLREARQPGGRTPVVRVLGIDAGFGAASFAPGAEAALVVSADAPSLDLQFFRLGPDHTNVRASNVLVGVPVSAPWTEDWSQWRNGPHTLRLPLGDWATGMYFLRLRAPDGAVGFAPFVLRPRRMGAARVAVVMPTMTWQAYNFRDDDADGWGDTWYAGPPRNTVRLGRPYLNRGVPPHFPKYEMSFLHWLAWTKRDVDYLADTDLERVPNGEALARRYDLVVFPGHTEYVTQHLHDVVERYRDLGGNLMFLSSNNFFWRVRRSGPVLTRTGKWRDLGHPEAELLGVQYLANDEGQRMRPYVVTGADAAPWVWTGTKLQDGDPFGIGYGIEIDARTKASPPGTIVLARVPDLYGAGYTAEMTYYETPSGAKVFSAGTMNFGGSVWRWPIGHMLQNLWTRLSAP